MARLHRLRFSVSIDFGKAVQHDSNSHILCNVFCYITVLVISRSRGRYTQLTKRVSEDMLGCETRLGAAEHMPSGGVTRRYVLLQAET